MATRIALPSNTAFKKNGVPVCGIDSISFGFGTVEDVDVSSFCQTDDYRQYKPGMKDAGEMTVSGKLDLDDAGVRAVLTDSATGATDTYTVELNADGTVVYTVTAYPRPLNMTANMGEADTNEIVFKISGKPTLVSGATTLF